MSAIARLALVAAGAAAGAVATRWATSDSGRRTLSELGSTSLPHRAALTGSGDVAGHGASLEPRPARENKVASKLLRVAQDVRAAMDQREGELRAQLGLPAPDQIKARRGHGTSAGTHR